jgi:hypothetical protein
VPGDTGSADHSMTQTTKLHAGEWVEVRPKAEILKSLDKNGRLEGLPFMPEMFAFCGKRFRVCKRAHKTCDTVNDYKGRKMKDAVHLEGIRCDGQAHGGCQAACLIFWKEAWLNRVSDTGVASRAELAPQAAGASQEERSCCTEDDVMSGVQRTDGGTNEPVYVCQATQVPAATTALPWWDMRQYVEDYASGNVSLGTLVRGFIFMSYRGLINLGIGLGPTLRWLYDRFQSLCQGIPYPLRLGKLPLGARTPACKLDLRPGEWVRVKSYQAILATCDRSLKNRGMHFDKEMVPYCGGTYRVLGRVNKIINEKTGMMQQMKTPCVILESVVCQSRYSECRLFCPRSIYSYWREIWLERVPGEVLPKLNYRRSQEEVVHQKRFKQNG